MTETSPSESIGWPVPWIGLLLGVLFVVGMTSEIGSLVGLLMVFLLMAGLLPLVAVFGPETGALVGVCLLGGAAVVTLTGLLIGVWRARTVAQRRTALTILVVIVSMVLGVMASFDSLDRHWP